MKSNPASHPSVSDADYRLLFESVPGRFVVLLPDVPKFTVVAVSDAYLKTVNKSREAMVGRGLFEIFPEGPDPTHTQTIRNLRASFRRVVSSGEPDSIAAAQQYDLEGSSTGKPPEERHWMLVSSPVLHGDGTVRFISHRAEDVTEQVVANRRQGESEARLAAIFESLPVGVGIVDTEGALVLSNQEMRRFWPTGTLPSHNGTSRWRWRGPRGEDHRPGPDDFPGARALRGERVLPGVEMLYRQDDGRELWTRVTAVPVQDSQGRITGQVSVITDIDDLKRISESVSASDARREFLLKLSDAIRQLRDPEAIKAAACRVLTKHLRTNRAFYAEIDGDDWVIEGRYEEGVRSLAPGRYAAGTYGQRIMNTYRAGKNIIFHDAQTDPEFAPDERAAHLAIDIVAAVGVPLIKERNLVAILAIHSAEPRNWTDEEIALVEETAERTWAAVERARSEASLRESESKYRTLFESIDEGFCIIEVLFDDDGLARDYRFLEINPAFEKQTGMVGAVGRTMREFVPEHEERWFAIYGAVARSGVPARFQQVAERMGRFFDLYAFRVGDPRDSHVAVLFRDITEREHARAALERAEKNSRTILDSISDGFLAIDRAWRFTFINRAAERILDQRVENLVGTFLWEQYPGLIGSVFETVYRRAMESGEFGQTIAYFPDHDRYYDVTACPYEEGITIYFRNVTEQKRAEVALRESETRFRVLMESLPQLVWSCLPDGSCDYLSPQWVAYTGVPESEQLDLRWLDRVIHPEDRERTLEHWLGAVAGHHNYDIEYRIRGANGTYRWFQTRGVPFRDSEGSIVKWFGTCTDIEKQKQAEADLRSQWHTFDTALSHTPDFTYIFNLQGQFTYVNRALLSLWQKSLEDAVGKDFFELGYPAELAARLQRHIRQVIDTGEPARDHTPFTGPTGETRQYEYILVPILDGTGKVEAVAGATRDVTERYEMQRAIAESEERLRRVFSQAPVGVALLAGRDLTFELVNPSYQEFFPGRDLLNRPLYDAVPEVNADARAILKRVYETGEPFVGHEYLIPLDRDNDGIIEDCWFTFVYQPLKGSDGAVTGIVVIAMDVGTHVRARKELERANRELEEFAYVASHDLQEPLRMVNIYTQLLMKRHVGDSSQAKQYADVIHRGVKRMELLIYDLLTFSRTIHAEDNPYGTADLSVALSEATSVLKDRMEQTSAIMDFPVLPTVHGDTTQFAQVFQNLLANALKYQQSGTQPKIKITTASDGPNWIIAIQDNGIGFEPQYADRIFGLFKRLHKDEYPGTGLGLAICRRIIERHGGRIWAESTLGEGSTFYFSLPRLEAA